MGSHPERIVEKVFEKGVCAAAQGTDRDDEHLNIFLEFVPGGSIASLLTKFGELAALCNACTSPDSLCRYTCDAYTSPVSPCQDRWWCLETSL